MALFPGCSTALVRQFKGAVTAPDNYSVDPSHLLYAQNARFVLGNFGLSQAGTRLGHSAVVTTFSGDGPITSMANWYFVYLAAQQSAVLVYAPAVGIRAYQQVGGWTSVLIPVTGAAGASMSTNGERLIAAFYDSTGRLPANKGYIYGWNVGADALFAAPMVTVPTMSEPASGVITAGAHRIAYLAQTRNGFTTKLSPCPGDVFSPVTFTASGSKNANFALTGTLPSYMVGGVATIQVVMTTVANPNRWYAVPGAVATASTSVSITFSISDDDLAATGTDVTGQLDLLTETVSGTPPFSPTSVFPFGSRMGYATPADASGLGVPAVFFSEPNDYQHLTADQHEVPLPAQDLPVVGFALRDVCYVASPFSMYSFEDNGDVPVTWTPPQKVDGSVGVLSATCVMWRPDEGPSLGYAAIASVKGFYIFRGGVFPSLPISYYQSDWQRINWTVPTTVQLAEDSQQKKFIVLAPLSSFIASVSGSGPYTVTTATDPTLTTAPHLYQTGLSCVLTGVTGAQSITVTGANTFTIPGGSGVPTVGGLVQPQTASHEMTWDYTEGDTPDTVKYSLNSFSAYRAGAIGQVLNISNYLNEVWYAPSAGNSKIIRASTPLDTTPYQDVDLSGAATAINTLVKLALLPNTGDQEITIHDFQGMHFKASGNGSVTILAEGLGGSPSVTPLRSPVTLQAVATKEELVKWYLRSEQQSIQFGTNTIGYYFMLSLVRCYYTNSLMQR